jgi:hypothetical protein
VISKALEPPVGYRDVLSYGIIYRIGFNNPLVSKTLESNLCLLATWLLDHVTMFLPR